MRQAKIRRLAFRLHIEEEINIALLEPQDVLGPMPGHSGETHAFECAFDVIGPGAGELDNLETIRADWI
jgi:hypothetical protein